MAPWTDNLEELSSPRQWSTLILISAIFAIALKASGLPAALFLGPMVGGIVLGVNGGTIRVPRLPYFAAQGFMGCVIASSITPAIVVSFLSEWPLFLGIVLSIVAASSLLGWQMTRWRVFPGTTSVWGSSPGAANAMVIMAEAFGADARLVAFMQYSRVVCVALVASLVARFSLSTSDAARPSPQWFPPLHWFAFAETLAIALIGAAAGRLLRFPSGSMVLPMVAGSILHASGAVEIELPQWVLAVTYALLGWNIGLGFTRDILAHAFRALPKVLLSIAALISFSGFLAYILTRTIGIDPLSAYLATSPGGLDSVAIIAASSNVNLSFVMALQTLRFFIIVLIGPPLARYVARSMT